VAVPQAHWSQLFGMWQCASFCGVICNTIVIFHHRYFPWTRTLLLHDVLLPQGGVEEIAVE
jgi:hypothetical protein